MPHREPFYTRARSRRRELDLRMDLGASASNLLRLVFKGDSCDPLAFGSAFVVMIIASVAACLLPIWRATRALLELQNRPAQVNLITRLQLGAASVAVDLLAQTVAN